MRRRFALVASTVLSVVGVRAASASSGTGLPPVLLDPSAAAAEIPALAESGEVLRAAELALLAGRPERTVELLRSGPAAEGPRALRLVLDAEVALGHRRVAEARLAELTAQPGWGAHVRMMTGRVALAERVDLVARGGALLYALAFGFLVLGAGRELLRLLRETAVFAAALALAVGVARTTDPATSAGIALAGAATLVLVHGAAAAARRLAPRPRIRLLLALTLVLGVAGAVVAILARLQPDLLR